MKIIDTNLPRKNKITEDRLEFYGEKKILKKNGFEVLQKKRAENFYSSSKFKKTFNYIFER